MDSMVSRPGEWIGATAIHSTDKFRTPLIKTLGLLCDSYPLLSAIVNFFDERQLSHDELRALVQQHARIEGTNIPGMKTLFWRRVLTPERVRSAALVWVFDCDIAVHPSVFPLGQLAGTLFNTNATLLQPSIRALVHGTYHPWLRVRPTHMSCVATTAPWVEMQTPLFSADAWSVFHTRMLSIVKDEHLAVSDFGIDITWCALLADAFPARPTCLVLPAETATHINSHAIEKYMVKSVAVQERSCTGTCKTLYGAYARFWKSKSHHTGKCWGTHQDHNGLVVTGRYSLESGGTVRSRPFRDPAPATNISEDGVSERRWLGATVIPYHLRDDRMKDGLLASLTALMNVQPKLRIIINHNDVPAPPAGRSEDVSIDSRVETTWVVGPRALFWLRVLSPPLDRGEVDLLWLFNYDIVAHPSVNPFTQLTQTLHSTNALAAGFAPPDASLSDAFPPPAKQSCVAAVAQERDMSSSIVFKPEGFRTFRDYALRRLTMAYLEASDLGFGRLLCPLLARMVYRMSTRIGNRPACVRLTTATLHKVESRHPRASKACDAACAAPLRAAFPDDFNASWHGESTCWVPASKGLHQVGKKQILQPPMPGGDLRRAASWKAGAVGHVVGHAAGHVASGKLRGTRESKRAGRG